jgi:hypothetical protein
MEPFPVVFARGRMGSPPWKVLSAKTFHQGGVRLGMTKIHPEHPDSDRSDHSLAAEVLLRQEPDEEEEEDEGDGKEDDDDDGDEDGYSE